MTVTMPPFFMLLILVFNLFDINIWLTECWITFISVVWCRCELVSPQKTSAGCFCVFFTEYLCVCVFTCCFTQQRHSSIQHTHVGFSPQTQGAFSKPKLQEEASWFHISSCLKTFKASHSRDAPAEGLSLCWCTVSQSGHCPDSQSNSVSLFGRFCAKCYKHAYTQI